MLLNNLHGFGANCTSLLQNSWWTADMTVFSWAECRLANAGREGVRCLPRPDQSVLARCVPRVHHEEVPDLAFHRKRDVNSASQDAARERRSGYSRPSGNSKTCRRPGRGTSLKSLLGSSDRGPEGLAKFNEKPAELYKKTPQSYGCTLLGTLQPRPVHPPGCSLVFQLTTCTHSK